MANVTVFYQLVKDGAPIRVLPVGNSAGEWVVICKCCGRSFVEPDRAAAFTGAEVHTVMAADWWGCASGKAASARTTQRLKRKAVES